MGDDLRGYGIGDWMFSRVSFERDDSKGNGECAIVVLINEMRPVGNCIFNFETI